MDFAQFLTDILIVLIAAKATAEISERIGIPAVVSEIVAGVIVLELAYVIWFRSEGLPGGTALVPRDAAYSSTEQLGQVLYTQYLYPFELAAMLLLLAIVAAILLTMRSRPGARVQDVAEQVRVRREDRVRIVTMKTESE